MAESCRCQTRYVDRGKLSEGVASVVSEATATPPEDLTPLFNAIDPDALNQLFPDASNREQTGERRIIFPFEGCWVIIPGDGRITALRRDRVPTPLTPPSPVRHETAYSWTEEHGLGRSLIEAVNEASTVGYVMEEYGVIDAVDLDALNHLFEPVSSRNRRDNGWVSFPIGKDIVTVEAAGRVRVSDDHASEWSRLE